MSATYDPILGKVRKKDDGKSKEILEILGTPSKEEGSIAQMLRDLKHGGVSASFVENTDGVGTFTMVLDGAEIDEEKGILNV